MALTANFRIQCSKTELLLMATNNHHSTMDDHLIVNDWLDLLTNK